MLYSCLLNIVSNSTTPVIMDTVITFRNRIISGSICTSAEYWSNSIPYIFLICAIVISSPFISWNFRVRIPNLGTTLNSDWRRLCLKINTLSWFGYHPPVFSSVCWLKFKVFLIMFSRHFIYWSIHAPFEIFQLTKTVW